MFQGDSMAVAMAGLMFLAIDSNALVISMCDRISVVLPILTWL